MSMMAEGYGFPRHQWEVLAAVPRGHGRALQGSCSKGSYHFLTKQEFCSVLLLRMMMECIEAVKLTRFQIHAEKEEAFLLCRHKTASQWFTRI